MHHRGYMELLGPIRGAPFLLFSYQYATSTIVVTRILSGCLFESDSVRDQTPITSNPPSPTDHSEGGTSAPHDDMGRRDRSASGPLSALSSQPLFDWTTRLDSLNSLDSRSTLTPTLDSLDSDSLDSLDSLLTIDDSTHSTTRLTRRLPQSAAAAAPSLGRPPHRARAELAAAAVSSREIELESIYTCLA